MTLLLAAELYGWIMRTNNERKVKASTLCPLRDRASYCPAHRRCPSCSRAAYCAGGAFAECRSQAPPRAKSDRRFPSVSAGLNPGACRALLRLALDALEFVVVQFLIHAPSGFLVAPGPVR